MNSIRMSAYCQELLVASQLYQLAQYVYTGLQGEQGGGISPDR